jgi:hypothetical protein
MSDDDENAAVDRIARELLDRNGADAPRLARACADAEGSLGNLQAAVRWRFIADAIERMQARSETV